MILISFKRAFEVRLQQALRTNSTWDSVELKDSMAPNQTIAISNSEQSPGKVSCYTPMPLFQIAWQPCDDDEEDLTLTRRSLSLAEDGGGGGESGEGGWCGQHDGGVPLCQELLLCWQLSVQQGDMSNHSPLTVDILLGWSARACFQRSVFHLKWHGQFFLRLPYPLYTSQTFDWTYTSNWFFSHAFTPHRNLHHENIRDWKWLPIFMQSLIFLLPGSHSTADSKS